MFALVRRCVEPITQACRLKVKVTVKGHKFESWISCSLHISRTLGKIFIKFGSNVHLRWCAEPITQQCRLKIKVTIEGHRLSLEFWGRSIVILRRGYSCPSECLLWLIRSLNSPRSKCINLSCILRTSVYDSNLQKKKWEMKTQYFFIEKCAYLGLWLMRFFATVYVCIDISCSFQWVDSKRSNQTADMQADLDLCCLYMLHSSIWCSLYIRDEKLKD